MKKFQLLALMLPVVLSLLSSCRKEDSDNLQTVDFESLAIPPAGYWNGSDATGFFQSGNLKFTNIYESFWMTWAGFSYSNQCNVAMKGFTNQYSVFDANNGRNQFALFYPSFDSQVTASFSDGGSHIIRSLDICNSTYSALSMRYGDSYCKQFGGTNGMDPDWFKVTLAGYSATGVRLGSMDVYLADFRATDASRDFILDKWTTIDLRPLGSINRLTFEFTSSDTGMYGINTPTYICLDNLKYVE